MGGESRRGRGREGAGGGEEEKGGGWVGRGIRTKKSGRVESRG